MKKVLAIAALMTVALSVGAQEVKFTVNGVCDKNGATINLLNRQTNKPVATTTVANGKFTFSGSAEKNTLMSVGDEKGSWMTLFFNDGTPVNVNLNDSTLKGSALNERLVGYDIALGTSYSGFMQKVQGMSEEEQKSKMPELQKEMRQIVGDMTKLLEKIFRDERETIIPVAFLNEYMNFVGEEELDSVLNTKPAFASHPLVKSLQDMMAAQKAEEAKKTAVIGKQFTDLEEADVDGKLHKLSEYVGKGQWVLVDFWASWCGPCRAEMPNVLEAYNKYHSKGFEVIGISFDEKKEAWVKAIGQINMPWMQLSDLKGWGCAAADAYKIDAIPDNILIDPQGKIVARALRGKALHSRLQKIFEE